MGRTALIIRRALITGALGASVAVGSAAGAGTAGALTRGATKPLTILVTNDDGYNAPGINAVVQALRTLP